MDTFIVIFLFSAGVILIIKGGDLFVDAAGWIAEASRIPRFVIGATVVSFATTLPELIVSLIAAKEGSVGICTGNAVGSVTANIGLILGISIVCIPAAIDRLQFAVKGALMFLAGFLLFLFARSGELKIGESFFLLAVFAVFMAESLREAKLSRSSDMSTHIKTEKRTAFANLVKFVLGAAGIVFGADLLVDNGSELARIIGVPEGIIGATMIAVGTSLPELVTTITAIAKKQASLSVGNILGANIIDLAVILPICTIASGGSLPIPPQTYLLDLPVCLGIILAAVIPAIHAGKFRRTQGIAMLILYAGYTIFLCIGQG